MYLVPLKSAVTEALKNTFNALYPDPDFQTVHVSIEFPQEKQDYPGIWINYSDTGPLERAGIDQRETILDSNGLHQVTRWRFAGSVSFTVAALSSLERDRIYDEMVRVLGFAGTETGQINTFRTTMETNNFLGINLNYDVFEASGDDAAPGTPWGTNEIIYERTLSTAVIGEFVSDPGSGALVPLSAVQVQGYRDGTPPPQFPDVPSNTPTIPWTPNQWT